jgi:hypothetical protein
MWHVFTVCAVVMTGALLLVVAVARRLLAALESLPAETAALVVEALKEEAPQPTRATADPTLMAEAYAAAQPPAILERAASEPAPAPLPVIRVEDDDPEHGVPLDVDDGEHSPTVPVAAPPAETASAGSVGWVAPHAGHVPGPATDPDDGGPPETGPSVSRERRRDAIVPAPHAAGVVVALRPAALDDQDPVEQARREREQREAAAVLTMATEATRPSSEPEDEHTAVYGGRVDLVNLLAQPPRAPVRRPGNMTDDERVADRFYALLADDARTGSVVHCEAPGCVPDAVGTCNCGCVSCSRRRWARKRAQRDVLSPSLPPSFAGGAPPAPTPPVTRPGGGGGPGRTKAAAATLPSMGVVRADRRLEP